MDVEAGVVAAVDIVIQAVELKRMAGATSDPFRAGDLAVVPIAAGVTKGQALSVIEVPVRYQPFLLRRRNM